MARQRLWGMTPRFDVHYYDVDWNELEKMRELLVTFETLAQSVTRFNRAHVQSIAHVVSPVIGLAEARFMTIEVSYVEI